MMLHRQLFTTGINIALARTKPISISKFQSFNSNYSTNLLKSFNSFKPTNLGIKQLPIFSVRYATTTKSNINKKEQQDQPTKNKKGVETDEIAIENTKSVVPLKSGRKPIWKQKTRVKDILFPQGTEQPDEPLKVNAFCTAESYDFDKLYAYLSKISPNTTRTTSSYEVIYRPYGQDERAQVFYFEGGSVVCWGTTQIENVELLRELKSFEVQPVDEIQTETMSWAYTDKDSTTLEKDTILISTELNDRDQTAHKLAFSYGMHQSVKLEVHEKAAEAIFQSMKDTPKLLLKKDWSLLSLERRRAVRKTHSELLQLRADINLYSELLEIPDIFWDEHHLEVNYKRMTKHLVTESRTTIVNKKIDYSDQLNKALRQQLGDDYGVRLEWLIIILIAVEVIQGLYLIWSEMQSHEDEEPKEEKA